MKIVTASSKNDVCKFIDVELVKFWESNGKGWKNEIFQVIEIMPGKL